MVRFVYQNCQPLIKLLLLTLLFVFFSYNLTKLFQIIDYFNQHYIPIILAKSKVKFIFLKYLLVVLTKIIFDFFSLIFYFLSFRRLYFHVYLSLVFFFQLFPAFFLPFSLFIFSSSSLSTKIKPRETLRPPPWRLGVHHLITHRQSAAIVCYLLVVNQVGK